MGLDLVEFVMAVEDEFDVPIPAEDWGVLRTVRDMEMYLVRLQPQEGVCINVPAFLRVRRAVIEATGLSRSSVRVATSLEDSLPRSVRRSMWRQICESLDGKTPELCTPPGLRFAVFGLLAGLFVLLVTLPVGILLIEDVHFGLFMLAIAAACASPLLVLIAGRIVDELIQPWKVDFAIFPPTVGQLSRYVARQDLRHSRSDEGGEPDPSDPVFERLQRIISRSFGIAVEEIRRDSRFIEDLGLG